MAAPKRKTRPAASHPPAQEPGATSGPSAGSYVLEWVNCGSPYCRKCVPGGQGSHGPYWYRYLWRDGQHLKQYVGKQLPESVLAQAGQQPAVEPHAFEVDASPNP